MQICNKRCVLKPRKQSIPPILDLKMAQGELMIFFFKKVTHSFTYFPHLRKIQFEEKVNDVKTSLLDVNNKAISVQLPDIAGHSL